MAHRNNRMLERGSFTLLAPRSTRMFRDSGLLSPNSISNVHNNEPVEWTRLHSWESGQPSCKNLPNSHAKWFRLNNEPHGPNVEPDSALSQ